MISKELSATLGFAVREAKKRRHEYVSVEHVLFAILHDNSGLEIVEKCGGNVENIKTNLEVFFNENMEMLHGVAYGLPFALHEKLVHNCALDK